MKAMKELLGLSVAVCCLCGCAETVNDGAAPEAGASIAKTPARAEEKPVNDLVKKPAVSAVKKGVITQVDLNRLLQLQDDGKVHLVDVRPRLFYGLGHLPGAVSMPRKSFPLSLVKVQAGIDAAVSQGKIIVLYCQNTECPDGYAVGKEMAEMGYSVSIYEGGWEQWKEMGF